MTSVYNDFKFNLDKYKILLINTDTVPGIITKLSDQESIKKIYDIKNRSINSPFAIFVSDINMAKKFIDIDIFYKELMEKYLPGYFTFIVKVKNNIVEKISENVLSFSDDIWKIAIRIPKSDTILKIIKEINEPLIATSANISGQSAPTKISNVSDDIKNHVKYFEIPNLLPNGLNSTIVDITGKELKIIRQGSGIIS